MKQKSIEQLIFPIIVGALSLFSISRSFSEFYITSFVVSLIGLIAVVLFFTNKKFSTQLFYIWIVAQVITFQSASFNYVTNQVPYYSLGLNFRGKESLFSINFLPFIFLIGYRVLKMYNLVGKTVSIIPIRENSALTSIQGEITEILKLSNNEKWFKVQFNEEGISEPRYVMIKPKGQEQFSHKKSIIGFVHESGDVTKFIDWGAVKLG